RLKAEQSASTFPSVSRSESRASPFELPRSALRNPNWWMMLVVMQSHAAPAEIDKVVQVIRSQGLTAHVMPGATRTAIGITGNPGPVDKSLSDGLPGVEEAIRVTKPYKLASREMKHDDTVIALAQGTIGPKTFTVVAGPCSVENEAMILKTAEYLVGR